MGRQTAAGPAAADQPGPDAGAAIEGSGGRACDARIRGAAEHSGGARGADAASPADVRQSDRGPRAQAAVAARSMERLTALPKAEVHVHLEGCLEPAALEKLAAAAG